MTRHLPDNCLPVANLGTLIAYQVREELLVQLGEAERLRAAYYLTASYCGGCAPANYQRIAVLHEVGQIIAAMLHRAGYDDGQRHEAALAVKRLLGAMAAENHEVYLEAGRTLLDIYEHPSNPIARTSLRWAAEQARRARRQRPDHLPPR